LETISKYPLNTISGGLDGTCDWAFNSDILKSWESNKGGRLLCHGKPGGGKTVLAGMVANRLFERYSNSSHVGIAHVFIGFDSSDLGTIEKVQRAILKQLCEKQPRVLISVPELSRYRDVRPPQPRAGDDILIRVMSHYSRVFLVVDGVDEFGTNMSDTKQLINHLRTLQSRSKASSNLLLTSAAVPEGLATWPKLEIRARDDDIVSYINSKTTNLTGSMLPNGHFPKEHARKIVEISDGM
jgi:SpoVK/Ycf46/Vps4 family AAA+-type ATPase